MQTPSNDELDEKSFDSSEAQEKQMTDEKGVPVANPLEPPRKRLGRKLNDMRPFYLYQWLDVLDPEGTWYDSQVVAIDDNKVRIHYKGFKEKHDEWLYSRVDHPHAQRILPLYTRTEKPRKYGEVKCGKGAILDVLDSSNNWLLGKIVEMNTQHDIVRIHYEGWDEKYDEWINAESPRLAPPNTFTKQVLPPTPNPLDLVGRNGTNGAQGQIGGEAKTGFVASADNERKFRDLLQREKSYVIVDQKDDGNCLFRTISHQVYGDAKHHDIVRARCMDYIESEQRFFQSYIAEGFDDYVARMRRDAEWGDHVEIQAMSKIYARPIEIYAYNTTPLKTSLGQMAPSAVPMRLSYHFQSHYNSVINEKTHHLYTTKSPPGQIEDEAIRKSRDRGGSELQRAQRASDAEATEMETLRRALGLSQEEFTNRNRTAFDEVVQRSLKELSDRFEQETEEAKRRSEQEAEEDVLRKAKEQSAKDQKQQEDANLKKVLEDSQNDELKRAMNASLVDKNWPGPVKECVLQGYPIDTVEIAYSIYCGHPNPEIVARNMLTWLKAQQPSVPAVVVTGGNERKNNATNAAGRQ